MVGLCKMSQSLMDGRAQARCVASSYQVLLPVGVVFFACLLGGSGRIIKTTMVMLMLIINEMLQRSL